MADQEIDCDVESLNEPFRTLVKAGICAPSGDNTQGWGFGIDGSGSSIEIFRNEQRDTSSMNAGQRMSSIACGACAENVLRTIEGTGWDGGIEYFDLPSIKISFDRDPSRLAEIPRVVARRHTNRKLYHGRRIGASERKTLEDRIDVPEGIELRIITDGAAINSCAEVIGRADATMFGQRRFLRAFLDNVRFDKPADFPVEFGLSIGSLELSLFERPLLQLMGRLPGVVTSLFTMRRAFKRKASGLVQSASGLCVIQAQSATAESEFKVGQIMQRAWLMLTELGFAVQPMMSLPVLLGDAYFSGGGETYINAGHDDFQATAFETIFGQKTNRFCPCAILRFGEGTTASARTGRLKGVSIRSSCVPRAKAHANGNS